MPKPLLKISSNGRKNRNSFARESCCSKRNSNRAPSKNEIKQIDSYCSWRRCCVCASISVLIIIAGGLGAAFGVANK